MRGQGGIFDALWAAFGNWLAQYHLTPTTLAIAIAALAFLVFWLWLQLEQPRFSLRPVMTKAEVRFFRLLEKAVPEFYIWPQVHMRAFLEPPQGKHYGRMLAKINQKRVDWLLADEQLNPVLIVELDDWSHTDSEKDRLRDSMPGAAGLGTIRFRPEKGMGAAEVREYILRALGR